MDVLPLSHFLIGIPGSGKSTFAIWLQQQTNGVIISPDEIRAELYGDAVIQGVWAELEAMILCRMAKAIAQNQRVIYDATNTNGLWRRQFLQRSPIKGWVAWQLQTPLQDCLERNGRRSRQVSTAIIAQMAQELEQDPPTCDDGFLELIPVIDLSAQGLRDLKKLHLQHLGD